MGVETTIGSGTSFSTPSPEISSSGVSFGSFSPVSPVSSALESSFGPQIGQPSFNLDTSQPASVLDSTRPFGLEDFNPSIFSEKLPSTPNWGVKSEILDLNPVAMRDVVEALEAGGIDTLPQVPSLTETIAEQIAESDFRLNPSLIADIEDALVLGGIDQLASPILVEPQLSQEKVTEDISVNTEVLPFISKVDIFKPATLRANKVFGQSSYQRFENIKLASDKLSQPALINEPENNNLLNTPKTQEVVTEVLNVKPALINAAWSEELQIEDAFVEVVLEPAQQIETLTDSNIEEIQSNPIVKVENNVVSNAIGDVVKIITGEVATPVDKTGQGEVVGLESVTEQLKTPESSSIENVSEQSASNNSAVFAKELVIESAQAVRALEAMLAANMDEQTILNTLNPVLKEKELAVEIVETDSDEGGDIIKYVIVATGQEEPQPGGILEKRVQEFQLDRKTLKEREEAGAETVNELFAKPEAKLVGVKGWQIAEGLNKKFMQDPERYSSNIRKPDDPTMADTVKAIDKKLDIIWNPNKGVEEIERTMFYNPPVDEGKGIPVSNEEVNRVLVGKATPFKSAGMLQRGERVIDVVIAKKISNLKEKNISTISESKVV